MCVFAIWHWKPFTEDVIAQVLAFVWWVAMQFKGNRNKCDMIRNVD